MRDNYSRALAYLDKLPPAISGSGGHQATFEAALACRRFGLTQSELWDAMQWFNEQRCTPPWSEKELRHKVDSATAMAIQKPLGASVRHRKVKRFMAPARPARRPADTRPICQRSEAEEEVWWAQTAIELGTTLEELDRRCGANE